MILENNKSSRETFPVILSQTLATLVLYNTSLENSFTFQSLRESLNKAGLPMDILIYDNSENPQKTPSSIKGWNIRYVHDSTNGGVSKAYNSAFEMAKRDGKKWLLLLDQDTSYPVSAISEYCRSLTLHPDQHIFIPRLYDTLGMVSPLQFKLGGGKRIKDLNPGTYSLHNFKFHNCGMLISTDAFEKAGGYDEQLPLDFSDFSFIERLKKNQSTFVVNEVTGNHHLASTSVANMEERAVRFKSYIQACRYYQVKYQPDDWKISVRLFLRSIKLSWTHLTFRFVVLYLNS